MRILRSAIFALVLPLLLPIASFSQLNMSLQDSLTYTVGVNDVCGWVDPDGKEYALVGLNTGVSIVDIDSDSLKEVAFVPGVNNLWRDINTYGHYAYVSSEARVGLLIIDLQFLPDSVQSYIWLDSLPTGNGLRRFEKAHTLFVDEFGILYLNGSNLNSGGVVMVDVATNPTDPDFLGYGPAIYSHDSYARNRILYSAEIYGGDASIYDATDPSNVTLIGRVKTPHEFTHNIWLSDNSTVMYTTDERPSSYVTSYDITDPGNIVELDRYRQASTEGSGNIVHNVYVWNDWLVCAYYANGTTIVDGSRPDNLVEVGNFDSFLGQDGGFPGVWGTFPWMPSGKILSSNRNSGLYVFIPNYVRACFLEGIVIDSITGLPVDNALVTIESDEIVFPQATKFNGEFKMGKAVPGQYFITITKEGYYDKKIQLDFLNGEVLTPTVELVPLPKYSVTGQVINLINDGVPFANVTLSGKEGTFDATCDEHGDFVVPFVYGGEYELQCGIWGQTYETYIIMDEPKELTLQVLPGYYDDFDLDLGWTISGNVTEGAWARGLPTRQILFDMWNCGSGTDSPNDNGEHVYSTGLSSTDNVSEDEVSGGTTWLISPPMDLTGAINPRISFDYWLCEYPPNQYIGLQVWITSGSDTVLLEELRNDTFAGSWQSKLYDDLSGLQSLDQVRFIISARDTTAGPSDYTLKAHFDKFKILDEALSDGDQYASKNSILVYPNPVTGNTIYLMPSKAGSQEITSLQMYDVHGRLMTSCKTTFGSELKIDHTLENGMYFMQWRTGSGDNGIEKVLILKD